MPSAAAAAVSKTWTLAPINRTVQPRLWREISFGGCLTMMFMVTPSTTSRGLDQLKTTADAALFAAGGNRGSLEMGLVDPQVEAAFGVAEASSVVAPVRRTLSARF